MTKFISIDEQLKKAKNFIAKGNIIDAKNCFQSVLNKYPKNTRALEGLKKIRQSTPSEEPNFNSSISKLIEYYNTGKYSELISFGQKVSKQFPEKAIIPNIIGAGHAALNQLSNAIDYYKNALKLEGLEFDGVQHRAIEDARNMAELFVKVAKPLGIV